MHSETCETLSLTAHSFLCHFCRSCKDVCIGVYSLSWEGNPGLVAFKKSRLETGVQRGGSEPALEQKGQGGGFSDSLRVWGVQVPARGRATGVELARV